MEDFGVLERFCGSPLWYNQSVYDSSWLPNLTPCFQHTILTWFPTIFFYLLSPILFLQVRLYQQQKRFRQLPWTWFLRTKLIFTAAALTTSLSIAVTNLFDNRYGQVDVWYPLVLVLFMVGFLVAQLECQRTGIVSSGILFTSSLIQFLCNLPEFYFWLQSTFGYSESTEDGWHSALFTIWFIAISGQLILQFYADQRYDKLERNSSTELDSSFLNRITMQWFTPLPILGSRQTITEKDLFDLNTENTSEHLGQLWEHYWRPKIENYNLKKKELLEDGLDTMLSKHDLLRDDGLNKKLPNTRGPIRRGTVVEMPSVLFTLFQIFKWQFFTSAGIRVLVDLLGFANPLLLHRLLGFVSSGSERLWEGAAYAILMFMTSELKSLGHNYVQFMMFRTSTKLQSILIGATYRKTLCLSNSARRDRTVGQIVNVMAIDIERIQMITHHLHTYWSTPFQVTLALIFLFQTLGVAALPGLFILLSFVPVSMFASYFQRRFQQRQMQLKDERTKMINEILNGIKIVKFNGWEPAMQNLVEGIRKQELHCIRAHSLIRSFLDCYNFSTPFLVALFSFATYIYIDSNNALTPQIAFVSLALFNQLRMPLMTIGVLINLTVQVIVSNKRIKELLTADEIDSDSIDRQLNKNGNLAICVENADFVWEPEKTAPTLRNISFEVETGQLIAITGRVGVGKSSLLSAILGEMEKLRGYVGVRGKIAYTTQEVWIQNISLRENIIFGQPFNEQLYNRIVKACALDADLAILPHGDMTEIGEKGINLSGGQRARISLARAIYQNADIYLLDDPLSAVDVHVGKHIFEHVVGPHGLLRNKTRVLVTHGVTFLREVNQILYIEDGQIIGNGGFDELMLKHSKFAALVAEASKQQEEEAEEDELHEENKSSELVEDFAVAEDEEVEELSEFVFQRQASTISTIMRRPHKKVVDADAPINQTPTNRLIKAEHTQTGNVKKDVYWSYVKAASVLLSSAFVLFYIGYAGLQLCRNFWLTAWSDDSSQNKTEQMSSSSRMAVYAGIGFVESACFALARIALTLGGLKASKNLHNPVLQQVLRSPMSFFDSTPIGRILNRFGREIEVVDMQLPINFRFFMQCTTHVATTILAITISTPIFVVVCIVLIGLYLYLLKFYTPTWRQLRRMESSSRSPIYSHFAETIQGASSIRAFNKQQDFCDLNNQKLDHFVRIKYMGVVSRPWFGVRLELLGNFVTFFAALFAALSDKMGLNLTAGMVGLSVTYALQITDMLRLAVQQISEMEVNLVSVERLKEYTELESEADWVLSENRPPKDWPGNGAVSFQQYSTRYRPGLDLVVRNISVNVKPGQKVGVVGRTGAGKSSLTLALFRMIEPADGKIIIDGVDIRKIGLHDLRSNLTIIPQEPVLFSGSLRFNLDPFGSYPDSELWHALEMSHLSEFVAELRDGLEHQIAEGGANISMGQRQLICLARALLRRSKILVLDEATASVDHQTDALIQQTIRREFAHSSLICIAHRLSTIIDYDAVLVMDKGEIREFAPPQELLSNTNSLFYSMAANARIVAKN